MRPFHSSRLTAQILGISTLTSIGVAQSTPTFGPPQMVSVGFDTSMLADLNQDGRLDLLAWNGCQLATGTGTFGPTLPFAAGMSLLQVGDINRDGKIDLVGHSSSSSISGTFDALLGDGTGQFTSLGEVARVTWTPKFADLSEFNSDGKLDLLISSYRPISWHSMDDAHDWIFVGDGQGAFVLASSPSVNSLIEDVGDFNGDGRLDWSAAWWNLDFVHLRFGNGAGGSSGDTSFYAGQYGATHVVIADLDSDGLGDLTTAYHDIFSQPDPPAVSVISNAGALQLWNSPVLTGIVKVADLNGDGRPEILIGFQSDVTLMQLVNLGSLTFSSLLMLETTDHITPVDVADFSGDGRPDLVLSYYYPTSGTAFRANTLAPSLPWVPSIRSIEPWGSAIAAPTTPEIRFRATGLSALSHVQVGTRTYGPGQFQLSADGNTMTLSMAPPPATAALTSVTLSTAAGSSAHVNYPLRLPDTQALLIDPPQSQSGQPAVIYFAGPRPGNLILPVASACLQPLALGPYVTFDIGGCGDLQILTSPPPFDASGLAQLPVTVPASLHGTIHVQFCDVDIADLLANNLPLAKSPILTLNIP
ncbi:MAG: VCBS repeat-containing protein [Planctomycetes bacterium]|nr:VCBS repeat-containing protein [Planctomycetota bacterium]